MSLLGSILGTAAQFIPVAGPIVSAGIGIADKVIDDKKAAVEAKEQDRSALIAQRKMDIGTESDKDLNPVMNNQYAGGVKAPQLPQKGMPLMGSNTLLGNKFGTDNTILGQAMNLETLNYR